MPSDVSGEDRELSPAAKCKLCNGKGYYRQSGGTFTEPCGGCGGTQREPKKEVESNA